MGIQPQDQLMPIEGAGTIGHRFTQQGYRAPGGRSNCAPACGGGPLPSEIGQPDCREPAENCQHCQQDPTAARVSGWQGAKDDEGRPARGQQQQRQPQQSWKYGRSAGNPTCPVKADLLAVRPSTCHASRAEGAEPAANLHRRHRHRLSDEPGQTRSASPCWPERGGGMAARCAGCTPGWERGRKYVILVL